MQKNAAGIDLQKSSVLLELRYVGHCTTPALRSPLHVQPDLMTCRLYDCLPEITYGKLNLVVKFDWPVKIGPSGWIPSGPQTVLMTAEQQRLTFTFTSLRNNSIELGLILIGIAACSCIVKANFAKQTIIIEITVPTNNQRSKHERVISRDTSLGDERTIRLAQPPTTSLGARTQAPSELRQVEAPRTAARGQRPDARL
ncbi:hypothetical protein EVAR_40265_1 [Eumeta japonica]|uniref:Uncharacterized protein n=1 Tax=Eumeta variegata TaxID=151549 RepID=A0A4C1Y5U7_EUMVA|nr:hypothetical protein EVAR_40265_1 [Eumeta japonica]